MCRWKTEIVSSLCLLFSKFNTNNQLNKQVNNVPQVMQLVNWVRLSQKPRHLRLHPTASLTLALPLEAPHFL